MASGSDSGLRLLLRLPLLARLPFPPSMLLLRLRLLLLLPPLMALISLLI